MLMRCPRCTGERVAYSADTLQAVCDKGHAFGPSPSPELLALLTRRRELRAIRDDMVSARALLRSAAMRLRPYAPVLAELMDEDARRLELRIGFVARLQRQAHLDESNAGEYPDAGQAK